MTGHRKVVSLGLSLVTLLALALLGGWGHLPQAGLETVSWAVVVVTLGALGANGLEHVAGARKSKESP